MPYRQLTYLPDRRSTRIDHSVPITLRGIDALGVSYVEYVSSLAVSCHGCSYESRNSVRLGDAVTLEAMVCDDLGSIIAVRSRVKSLKRLATKQMLFEIAVEFDSPSNIWRVASPPEDWLPAQEPELLAHARRTRELRVVPRAEQPTALNMAGVTLIARMRNNDNAASLPPFLAQLMAHLNELRMQLRDEASTILERSVVASLEDLACHQRDTAPQNTQVASKARDRSQLRHA